jgi:hypothetical protein
MFYCPHYLMNALYDDLTCKCYGVRERSVSLDGTNPLLGVL